MQKNHFLLYGHGGAYNHGGEAITKCTINMLRELVPDCFITLSTHFPEQDIQFKLKPDELITRNVQTKDNREMYQATLEKITPWTTAIQVGGDNYCYANWQRYAQIHQQAKKCGGRSILWGCSLDAAVIDKEMFAVLREHDLILAREGITYKTLTGLGLKNVLRVSDIAFGLKPEKTDIPIRHYIILNISPLVCRKNSRVIRAACELVSYIVNETDYNIILLPHVLMAVDNDLDALELIKKQYEKEERVFFLDKNLSAAEYKYVISNAELCIAARTHVTIASYSSSVPTLSIGYSTKARGIAEDLGFSEYVLDVEDENIEAGLINKFKELNTYKVQLRERLGKQMPQYMKNILPEQLRMFLKGEKG